MRTCAAYELYCMVVYYCVHPVSCNQALTCFNFTHENCLHKILVEPVFFFIIFLLWELLHDDIYTMHMFSLKLAILKTRNPLKSGGMGIYQKSIRSLSVFQKSIRLSAPKKNSGKQKSRYSRFRSLASIKTSTARTLFTFRVRARDCCQML